MIIPSIKPDLHIVVRVAEHSCDDASKRILKPSTYRLQIFLVRDQCLRSLLPHGDQAIAGRLKTCPQAYGCGSYDLYGNQALECKFNCLNFVGKAFLETNYEFQ